MITKTIEDIKKYARVASGFKYEMLQPEINYVADNEIVKAISLEEYTVLDTYAGSDAIVLKAIELIKNAEVNLALFNYVDVGSVQINATSVSVITPNNQQDASPKDLRSLKRLYKKKGYKAIDNVLTLFEKNEDKFPAWKTSEQYTNFKDLLVNNTGEFQEHYNIFDSRQTFLQLVPELKIVEQQYIIPGITKATLNELKTSTSTEKVFTDVKKLVSKAMVLYTVAKNLGSGQFYQSANGFELRFDILDYERNFADNKTLNSHTQEQKKQKENEAKEFLKVALTTIKENATLFSYVANEVESKQPFVNGKGAVLI